MAASVHGGRASGFSSAVDWPVARLAKSPCRAALLKAVAEAMPGVGACRWNDCERLDRVPRKEPNVREAEKQPPTVEPEAQRYLRELVLQVAPEVVQN